MIHIENQLTRNIERFEAEGPNRDLAIRRIHYNWTYFSTLLNERADWQTLARNIYRWYLVSHKELRRKKKVGVYWDPLGRRGLEKIKVRIPPLRAPEREAYKEQSKIIARQICALNNKRAEPQPAAVAKVPAKAKEAKSGPKGFEGLGADSFSSSTMNLVTAILTSKKQLDAYLLWKGHDLTVAEIARRLGISRPAVDKRLAAAKKRLNSASAHELLARQAEKNRQHRD